jgi:hypothetical protein
MDKMNITSAQYNSFDGQNVSIKATIDGTEMSVPLDPANRHYAEILRQVEAGNLVIQEAEGNEPLPADEV